MQPSGSLDWCERLTASAESREAALATLRETLLSRVRNALSANQKVDEGFVEDVVQDGLVAILASLDQFQGRSKFTTWATTITLRIAFTEMRRARWKDVSLEQMRSNEGSERSQNAVRESSEARLLRSELVSTMHRVIDEQLTEKQRTVLRAELQGMPQEEVGRRMGSNRNAVYKLVHDARRRLKKGMIEAGYSADDLASFTENSR